MNCPTCNQPMAANARFCANCGAAVASPDRFQNLQPSLAAAGPQGPGASAGPAGSADTIPALIARIRNMILTPRSEWSVIEHEATTIGQLYISYVAPLALIAAVLAFIHLTIIGVQVPFGGTVRQPFMGGLMALVMTLVGAFIGLLIVGLVINVLAPMFGGTRDIRQAMKTAAYAFTPAWLGAVFNLLPLGTLLALAADCYAIYVLYLGLPIVMRGKPDKAAV